MMRINGWYRLWIVASVLMAAGCGFIVYEQYAFSSADSIDSDAVRTMALVWAIGSVALLLLGHLVAWALRGFGRQKKEEAIG